MTLQLEPGKFYRIADGRTVGPMIYEDGLFIIDDTLDDWLTVWNPDGTADFFSGGGKINEPYNIVSEVQQP